MTQLSPDARAKIAKSISNLPASPSIAQMLGVRKELAPLLDGNDVPRLRLGCVASFTFEPLKTAIELQGLKSGLAIELFVGPFGQFEQQLIDGSSAIAKFNPEVLIVALRLQELFPVLYSEFNSLTEESARNTMAEVVDRIFGGIQAFRKHSTAKILLHNFDLPPFPALGLAESNSGHSQYALIRDANRLLQKGAASVENVSIVDYAGIVDRHGRKTWSDARMALFARIPIAAANYWHLAGLYAAHLRAIFGLSKKVLCLDADNTLWGGVVGDVGPQGITLGHDYPGNAYAALQMAALDLYHRGVLLCLNSKNDEANVFEILDQHPDMILRRKHFAAMRINWEDKHKNLRSMAEELNLGPDSFVFVDDHPVECEMMRTALPEVLSVQLPGEPALYEEAIRSLDCFDQLTITQEDRQRGQLYQAEAKRKELASAALDLSAFYRQLEMVMSISVDDSMHAGRAAQMTQRTNQFNMNTIRCSEDEIRSLMKEPSNRVITLGLADKFGDNGVIGLAVIKILPSAWHLQQFMMSCRVLGRTIEQNFIRWIARQAAQDGARGLTATYVATPKNKPFADFYQSCGFVGLRQGGAEWTLTLADAETDIPDYITLIENHSRRDSHAHK